MAIRDKDDYIHGKAIKPVVFIRRPKTSGKKDDVIRTYGSLGERNTPSLKEKLKTIIIAMIEIQTS